MDKKKKKPGRAKRVVRRIIVFLLLLAILAGGGYYAYLKLKSEYTVTYKPYTAAIGSISNSLSFTGSMSLINNTTYTADGATTVRTVYVAEGDTVKKGDKLMRLANGTAFTADFDGKVNRVYVEKDDSVSNGTSLIQIADFTHMKTQVRVDEYDIGDVNVGDRCTVTLTATGKTYESSIASIDYISASQGNVAYYTTTVYLDVDEGIYPGMQVTITVPQEEAADVVVLKMDAISFDASNNAFVYVAENGDEKNMTQQQITTGVSNGNYVEITSGLKEGDTVYTVVQNTETASGMSSLLSGLFGGTNISGGSMPGSRNGSGSTKGTGTNGGGSTNAGGSSGAPSGW